MGAEAGIGGPRYKTLKEQISEKYTKIQLGIGVATGLAILFVGGVGIKNQITEEAELVRFVNSTEMTDPNYREGISGHMNDMMRLNRLYAGIVVGITLLGVGSIVYLDTRKNRELKTLEQIS